jgi:hypothetical protein
MSAGMEVPKHGTSSHEALEHPLPCRALKRPPTGLESDRFRRPFVAHLEQNATGEAQNQAHPNFLDHRDFACLTSRGKLLSRPDYCRLSWHDVENFVPVSACTSPSENLVNRLAW